MPQNAFGHFDYRKLRSAVLNDHCSMPPPPFSIPASPISHFISSAISSNFEHLLAFSPRIGHASGPRGMCTCCNAATYKGHSPNATLGTDQRSPRHPKQEQLIPHQLSTCRNSSIKSGLRTGPRKNIWSALDNLYQNVVLQRRRLCPWY